MPARGLSVAPSWKLGRHGQGEQDLVRACGVHVLKRRAPGHSAVSRAQLMTTCPCLPAKSGAHASCIRSSRHCKACARVKIHP